MVARVLCCAFLTAAISPAAESWRSAPVNLGCTGVMIHRSGGWTYGLSAGHCAGDPGEKFRVTFLDGSTDEAWWVRSDARLDLSLFRVKGVRAIAPVPRVRPVGKVVGFGVRKGAGPRELGLEAKGTVDVKTLSVTRDEYEVVSGKFGEGCSGGPLIVGGKTVGLITHGDGDDVMFAASLSQIREFLDVSEAKVGVPLRDRSPHCPVCGVPLHSDRDRTDAIHSIFARLKKLEQGSNIAPERGPVGPAGPRGEVPVELLNRIELRLDALEKWRANFRATIRVKVSPRRKSNDR